MSCLGEIGEITKFLISAFVRVGLHLFRPFSSLGSSQGQLQSTQCLTYLPYRGGGKPAAERSGVLVLQKSIHCTLEGFGVLWSYLSLCLAQVRACVGAFIEACAHLHHGAVVLNRAEVFLRSLLGERGTVDCDAGGYCHECDKRRANRVIF